MNDSGKIRDPEIEQESFSFIPDIEDSFLDGRDEMNFAEFPVCPASTHRRKGNQVSFSDMIENKGTGETVERRLTVTGATEFGGLPTASDEEVIVGLIQLSRIATFKTRTVVFRRRQLLQMLGWSDNGQNYKRIKEALNRWLSIVVDYENSWWDKERQEWMSEKFSILESVTYTKDVRGRMDEIEVSWNRLVFRNFRSGNIKRLDYQDYKRLTQPIARRMYRFLDKRFYMRQTLSFPLAHFAHNKIGISKSYGIGQIKQRFEKPIQELEDIGFIQPADIAQRYKKRGKGNWVIHFQRARPGVRDAQPLSENSVGVAQRLQEHGVSPRIANRLCAENPEEYVLAKIEYLEFLKDTGNSPKKPPAWLVGAIDDDYQLPKDFKTRAEREQEASERENRVKARQEKKEQQKAVQKDAEAQKRAMEAQTTTQVQAYLSSLSETERNEVTETALNGLERMWRDKEGPMGDLIREQEIERYVLTLLEKEKTNKEEEE